MILLSKLLLLAAGLINFLPVIGVLSSTRIANAYGIALEGADLELLLRHRALLFGLVGGFLLLSVLVPAWQWQAITIAAISMVGFICLAWELSPVNDSLVKIVIADAVGLVCLLAAAILKWVSPVTP